MKHLIYLLALIGAFFVRDLGAELPRYDHVVVVIEENRSFGQIIGSAAAPNINALAAAGANIVNAATDPEGNISGSHAVRHPSQPNYLEFYSASNQGVLTDSRPGSSSEPLSSAPPFDTPNLGAQLRNAGFSFATYSEDLPSVGFDGDSFGGSPGYQRKHNPVANWMNDVNATVNQLPSSVNQPFTTFQQIAASPGGFANLPTVSFIVPNQTNDMHDGTIQQGDAWLKQNIIDTYLPWAMTHNSLLIVTWDEDATNTPTNQIPTIFAGAHVRPGVYTETNLNLNNPYLVNATDPGIETPTGTAMNHWNVLATIEDIYALSHIANSTNRPAVTDVFVTAASRKNHRAAGTFDLPLPLSDTPAIESRSGGATGDYQIVVTFGAPPTYSGAMIAQGTATISSTSTSGNQILVNLTGVLNSQTIAVKLLSVTVGGSTSDLTVPMSILIGDTNADGFVDSADIAQTKSQSGISVGPTNFREDVNIDGFIDSADTAFVKSKSGTTMPAAANNSPAPIKGNPVTTNRVTARQAASPQR